MLPSYYPLSWSIPSPVLINNSFTPSPLSSTLHNLLTHHHSFASHFTKKTETPRKIFYMSHHHISPPTSIRACVPTFLSVTLDGLLGLPDKTSPPTCALDPILSQCHKDISLAILSLPLASSIFFLFLTIAITYKHALVFFIKNKTKNLLTPHLPPTTVPFSLHS